MSEGVQQVISTLNKGGMFIAGDRMWVVPLMAVLIAVLLIYIAYTKGWTAKLGLTKEPMQSYGYTSSPGNFSWASGGGIKGDVAQDQVYFQKDNFMNSAKQDFTPGPEKKLIDGSTVVEDSETGAKYKVVNAQVFDDTTKTYVTQKTYVPWRGSTYAVGGLVVDSNNCADSGLGEAQEAWGWLASNIGSERDPNAQFNTAGLKKENMLSDKVLNANLHGMA